MFKIKKSSKLLNYILSGTLLSSFLISSASALEIPTIFRGMEPSSHQIWSTDTPDISDFEEGYSEDESENFSENESEGDSEDESENFSENESEGDSEDESENNSENESEDNIEKREKKAEIFLLKMKILRTTRDLESKIENAKRTLESYNLSPNDRVYLSLVLQSTYETILHYISNANIMNISTSDKSLMETQYFQKTLDEKINMYRINNPNSSFNYEVITTPGIMCSRLFMDIFNTSHLWAREQYDFTVDFANQILTQHLQSFVDSVCGRNTFDIMIIHKLSQQS